MDREEVSMMLDDNNSNSYSNTEEENGGHSNDTSFTNINSLQDNGPNIRNDDHEAGKAGGAGNDDAIKGNGQGRTEEGAEVKKKSKKGRASKTEKNHNNNKNKEKKGKVANSSAAQGPPEIVVVGKEEEKTSRVLMSEARVIDYVLVYKKTDQEPEHVQMRSSFEENLLDYGIQIQKEESESECFVLLHCPWDTLCRGAQLIKLKKPVNKESIQLHTTDKWLGCIKGSEVKMQVHQPFSLKEFESFLIENKQTFFSNAERNYITYCLLQKTVYQTDDSVQLGIDTLLGENVYRAAYPLHDPLPTTHNPNVTSMNEREFLLHKWAARRNFARNQPLSVIRSYFGEQFAFYFSWLGMYTAFLSVAALVGIVVTLYGVLSLYTKPELVSETCDSTRAPGNFTLCPKCDRRCSYSKLSDMCAYARFTQVFDNSATLFFSIFICIWAICFCEMWKRRQYFLQYLWSVNDFENHESIRPEYQRQATQKKKNPISGLEEFFVPFTSIFLRRLVSISMVLIFLIIVIISIVAVLIYRLAIAYALYQSSNITIKMNAKIITTFTAALINVFFITILSKVYMLLAKILTDIEAHKTSSSYQDSFVFKVVIFQFINNYGSLIYIAFFKGSFVDSPGHNSMYVFGRYKQDECEVVGCMWELTVQLMIVMIAKQMLSGFIEMIIPFARRAFRMRNHIVAVKYQPWERDLDLESLTIVPLYAEYIEMVVQYGFVVLFVAAFPLAPFFALINNLIEIRMDAYKLLKLTRRPPGLRAQDIGAWQQTIETFSHIAVITNAFILAWTSDFIPKQVYSSEHAGSMEGFMHYTLASFNTSSFSTAQQPDFDIFPEAANITECKFRSYTTPSSQVKDTFRSFYWHVLCARWAFVIVFEHTCFLIMSLFKTIPDKSDNVKLVAEYERTVHSQVAVDDLFERVKSKRSSLKLMSPFLTPSNLSHTSPTSKQPN